MILIVIMIMIIMIIMTRWRNLLHTKKNHYRYGTSSTWPPPWPLIYGSSYRNIFQTKHHNLFRVWIICDEYVQTNGFDQNKIELWHYSDVIMEAMASQITRLTIVYSTVYSGADQRKNQSSASLAFVQGIHRWSVNSPHKRSLQRKMFPYDDVIMNTLNFMAPLLYLELSSMRPWRQVHDRRRRQAWIQWRLFDPRPLECLLRRHISCHDRPTTDAISIGMPQCARTGPESSQC